MGANGGGDPVGPAGGELRAAVPIPPHVTYDEMKSMAGAVLKGDPNGWHVVGEIAKNKAAELFTRVRLPSKIDG
jgi:pyruvate dehydrogenase (quinone)